MTVKRISDEVYAKTEQSRHEAEVRYVAKQKAPWIREHLGKVKEKRGDAEYHRLRNAVLIERENVKSTTCRNAGKAEPTHYQSQALGG